MNPAIYQQWKQQQAERQRRERLRAARQPQPAVAPPAVPEDIPAIPVSQKRKKELAP